MGLPGASLHAPYAALLNGAFAHAFEQDSLRYPGAGVHPGATLLPAALAMCEERGADGRALLTAFVAGCEVMFRIGTASKHSSESLGFHAPGLTGPYGAAIAAGKIAGLDTATQAAALGIAGSLSAGLLAFSKAGTGGAVKRLHLGRAAEAGVLAAGMASAGIAGPETVLEGRFGFLEAFCRDADSEKLTAGLGKEWETRNICLKCFPCHVTAHTPVLAVRRLMAEHGLFAGDVTEVIIECAKKLSTHHNILAPRDLMQAQYSVPFCTALALFRDPADPRSFDDAAVHDADILAACAKIRLVSFPADFNPQSGWHTRVQLKLRDGRHYFCDSPYFEGMPNEPMSLEGLREKFRLLTKDLGDVASDALFSNFDNLAQRGRF